jgi:hypothetical protein
MWDEEFINYQNEQNRDYWSMKALSSDLKLMLREYTTDSEASALDRAKLKNGATKNMIMVVLMRGRGKTMFEKVERNYELYCLEGAPGPLPCSNYRETYRLMIADTLQLGGAYYRVTEDSWEIFFAIGE